MIVITSSNNPFCIVANIYFAKRFFPIIMKKILSIFSFVAHWTPTIQFSFNVHQIMIGFQKK